MKQLKEIPKFKTEDEEREFWDSVDNIFDYLDPAKFVETDPPMVPKTISMSVPVEVEREVRRLSQERKVSIEEMARQLLAAGLQQQRPHLGT
ncbi:MAG TPA: CopG family antitoxin [Candidatus Kapabacteria bacterium]